MKESLNEQLKKAVQEGKIPNPEIFEHLEQKGFSITLPDEFEINGVGGKLKKVSEIAITSDKFQNRRERESFIAQIENLLGRYDSGIIKFIKDSGLEVEDFKEDLDSLNELAEKIVSSFDAYLQGYTDFHNVKNSDKREFEDTFEENAVRALHRAEESVKSFSEKFNAVHNAIKAESLAAEKMVDVPAELEGVVDIRDPLGSIRRLERITVGGVSETELIDPSFLREYEIALLELKNALGSIDRESGSGRGEIQQKIYGFHTALKGMQEEIKRLSANRDSKRFTTPEEGSNVAKVDPASVGRKYKGPFNEGQREVGSKEKKIINKKEQYNSDYDESFIDEALVTVDRYEAPKAKKRNSKEELNDYEHEERLIDEAIVAVDKKGNNAKEEKVENSSEGREEYSLKEIFDDVEQKRIRLAELTENLNPVHVGTSESRRAISEAISFILAYQDTPESEISEEVKKQIKEKHQGIIDTYEAVTFDLAEEGKEGAAKAENEDEEADKVQEKDSIVLEHFRKQLREEFRAQREAREKYLDALKENKKSFQAIRGLQALTGDGVPEELQELKKDFDEKYAAYAEKVSQLKNSDGSEREVGVNVDRRIEREAQALLKAQIEGEPGRIGRMMQKVGNTFNKVPKPVRTIGRYVIAGGIGAAAGGITGAGIALSRMIFGTAAGTAAGVAVDRVMQRGVNQKEENLSTEKTNQQETIKKGDITLQNIQEAIEVRRKAQGEVYTSESRKKAAATASALIVGFLVGRSTGEVLEDFAGSGSIDDTKAAREETLRGLPDSDTTGGVAGEGLGDGNQVSNSDMRPDYSGIDALGDSNVEFQPPAESNNIDPITVEKGDTLWGHMEESFKDKFSDLSPSERDVVLDKIVDHLERNPELGNQIGVGEDPHLIHPGDVLNLNPLNDLVDQYIGEVKGDEIASNETLPEPPAREEVPPEPPSREDIPPEPTVRPEGEGEMITFEEEAYRGTPERGEGPYETRESSLPLHEYRDRGINASFNEVFPSENGFLGIGGSASGVDSPTWNQMKEVSADRFFGPQAALDNINLGTADQKEFISNLVNELSERTGEQPQANESVIDFLGRTIDPAIRDGYRFPNMGIGAVA